MSPTARSLAYCRKMGWTAGVVEQTIPKTFIKRDFLGFADMIVLRPDLDLPADSNVTGIVAVQVTSGSEGESGGHHADRVKKIQAEPRAAVWKSCGGLIEVWSWSKQGARGKRKVWTLREESL